MSEPRGKRPKAKQPRVTPVPVGSGVQFTGDDETSSRLASQWKDYFAEIAERLERGDVWTFDLTLTPIEARRVAGALPRVYADQISQTPPRKRGQKPQVDYGEIALRYALAEGAQKAE